MGFLSVGFVSGGFVFRVLSALPFQLVYDVEVFMFKHVFVHMFLRNIHFGSRN